MALYNTVKENYFIKGMKDFSYKPNNWIVFLKANCEIGLFAPGKQKKIADVFRKEIISGTRRW